MTTLTKKQRREIVAELRERAKSFASGTLRQGLNPDGIERIDIETMHPRGFFELSHAQIALYRDLLAEAIEQGDLP